MTGTVINNVSPHIYLFLSQVRLLQYSTNHDQKSGSNDQLCSQGRQFIFVREMLGSRVFRFFTGGWFWIESQSGKWLHSNTVQQPWDTKFHPSRKGKLYPPHTHKLNSIIGHDSCEVIGEQPVQLHVLDCVTHFEHVCHVYSMCVLRTYSLMHTFHTVWRAHFTIAHCDYVAGLHSSLNFVRHRYHHYTVNECFICTLCRGNRCQTQPYTNSRLNTVLHNTNCNAGKYIQCVTHKPNEFLV